MNDLPEAYFADYESFSENEIVEITQKGISLRNGIFIDFLVCAENFKKANPKSSGKCVGEREITDWSFTFYTNPKPIMIIFIPRNKLIEFFSANDTRKRFHYFTTQDQRFWLYHIRYDIRKHLECGGCCIRGVLLDHSLSHLHDRSTRKQ